VQRSPFARIDYNARRASAPGATISMQMSHRAANIKPTARVALLDRMALESERKRRREIERERERKTEKGRVHLAIAIAEGEFGKICRNMQRQGCFCARAIFGDFGHPGDFRFFFCDVVSFSETGPCTAKYGSSPLSNANAHFQ